jgi:hypothetical protein
MIALLMCVTRQSTPWLPFGLILHVAIRIGMLNIGGSLDSALFSFSFWFFISTLTTTILVLAQIPFVGQQLPQMAANIG